MRHLSSGLAALVFAAGVAPAMAHDAVIVCPDPYCGHRKYADPYIADGWRGSDHEDEIWPDFQTYMRMRTMRAIYSGPTPVLVPRRYGR